MSQPSPMWIHTVSYGTCSTWARCSSNNPSTEGGAASTPKRLRYASRAADCIAVSYRFSGYESPSGVVRAVRPRAALAARRPEPTAGRQRAAVGRDRVADEEVRQITREEQQHARLVDGL